MKKTIIAIIIFFSCVCSLYPQNRIIQGKIIDPDFETIVGVFIVINDSVCVGKSKLDGSFQVEIPSFVSKLSFCGPSYEQAYLQIDDSCNFIELIMIEDPFYHMSYRKINRYRMKKYKQLPKLHKEAYEKGIFQSPNACYVQEFHKYQLLRPVKLINVPE